MIIKNALVFDEKNGFLESDIFTDGQYISDTSPNQDSVDGTGLYAIPGLIDLHFHGCNGADFCEGTKESLDKITSYQASNGVTAIAPASLTLPIERLATICKNTFEYSPDDNSSAIVGIHLEGPFISSKKIGAQNPKYIVPPSLEALDELIKLSGGLAKIISVAPEVEGVLDLIAGAKDRIRFSIAHTTANYDTACRAFEAGASHVTHLYNAMPPFSHREPGVIGAAFDCKNAMVELITDGVHIHPAVVRATFKMFGDDRVIIISDSMMATGLGDGKYSLGELDVTVNGNRATLDDGTIASSVSNLMDCLKTVVKQMDIPLASAVKGASTNPAKALGVDHLYGSLSSGKIADIVLLDKSLEIKNIILRGKLIK